MQDTAPITGYRFVDEGNQHLHLFEDKPLRGNSSIVKRMKPPLAYWASGHAVKTLGVTEPKLLTIIKKMANGKLKPTHKDWPTADKMAEIEKLKASVAKRFEEVKLLSTDEFLTCLIKAYNAHAESLEEAADDGKDLHAELEAFVKDEMAGANKPIEQYPAKIHPVVIWSRENVAKHLWSEAHCFSLEMWIGGISDWGVELKDGRTGIIDFKSSKEAYQTQFWQAAGYDIEIMENGLLDRNGKLIMKIEKPFDFYAIIPFGGEVVAPVFNDQLGEKLGLDMSVSECQRAFDLLQQLDKMMPSEK